MSADTKDQMLMMAAQTVDEQATALLKAFTATFAGDFTTIFKMAEVTRSCKAPIQHPSSFHLVLLPFYFFHNLFFFFCNKYCSKKNPNANRNATRIPNLQHVCKARIKVLRTRHRCGPSIPNVCIFVRIFIVGGARGKKKVDVAN